jgi:hypothetical protein
VIQSCERNTIVGRILSRHLRSHDQRHLRDNAHSLLKVNVHNNVQRKTCRGHPRHRAQSLHSLLSRLLIHKRSRQTHGRNGQETTFGRHHRVLSLRTFHMNSHSQSQSQSHPHLHRAKLRHRVRNPNLNSPPVNHSHPGHSSTPNRPLSLSPRPSLACPRPLLLHHRRKTGKQFEGAWRR